VRANSSPVLTVLRIIARWWWLVVIAVVISAAVGYFIRTRQPNTYFARATILFGQTFREQNTQNLFAVRELMSVYAGLLRRDKFLEPVIQDLNLNTTVEELNNRLQTVEAADLPLLEIIVGDTDPERAANIANAVAQELIDESPNSRLGQEYEFTLQQLREIQTQITELENRYNELIARGATLTSDFEITQNTLQIQSIQETLRDQRELYATLSSTLPDSANVLSIFTFASAQSTLVVTGSLISVILAAVGGLAISLATIVLIEYFDDRLRWHDGMEEIDGITVLGPLSNIPKNRLPLYAATMSESIETEVLRQLRAKLVLLAGTNQSKVVTVTSFDSGDGKSTTSANLALIAAQAGLRTILVDGDIRKGVAHEFFQLPNVYGLTDILASSEDIHHMLPQMVLESGYDNLSILPAGREHPDPASLFSRPRLSQLAELLRDQFDAIIFDTVPTVGGPDSAFITDLSDRIVIVLHAQRATERGLKQTMQALRRGRNSSNDKFGIVFNRVMVQSSRTYSQSYYRRHIPVSIEKLDEERANLGQKPGRSRHIIVSAEGRVFYSLSAASVKLGISRDTLQKWIKNGYISAELRSRRMWIADSEIQELLARIPRAEALQPVVAADAVVKSNGKSANGRMAEDLREAVLASAQRKNPNGNSD
jgi:polysaccharide biosynthesis transport protein